MATGARVRNAYVIYLQQGNSPEKFGLIPHNTILWHHKIVKDLSVVDEHA
jgi:hypothetical protein